jgi:DNA polymerase-3 subunit gamma/tau
MVDSTDIFGNDTPTERDPDMPEDALGPSLDMPPPPKPAPPSTTGGDVQPYRVLARKYRSQTLPN